MTSVVSLRLKVNPRSSRDRIVGWLGNRLKISVTAPPEKGKANEAVVQLLSRTLRISAMKIRIVSGESASEKVVALHDVEEAEILSRLPKMPPPSPC